MKTMYHILLIFILVCSCSNKTENKSTPQTIDTITKYQSPKRLLTIPMVKVSKDKCALYFTKGNDNLLQKKRNALFGKALVSVLGENTVKDIYEQKATVTAFYYLNEYTGEVSNKMIKINNYEEDKIKPYIYKVSAALSSSGEFYVSSPFVVFQDSTGYYEAFRKEVEHLIANEENAVQLLQYSFPGEPFEADRLFGITFPEYIKRAEVILSEPLSSSKDYGLDFVAYLRDYVRDNRILISF